ncbi:hypothetical protein DUNSADRAFT_3620 [Dunaliella salina]|uniref:Uncharacterized protein n=1 Tax=Dunaliella salina TaxID=3046 RepID=A0ABQ7GTN0_DUNSA|nr:hypothetical protein DUNSADRAFT_3620 [Dunaliella salina]|eukprot:KAF5837959.1 hypothetical protein DUNSADRAFT_3620 [Dunaliella salina]
MGAVVQFLGCSLLACADWLCLACARRFAPCLPQVRWALWCNSWAVTCLRAQVHYFLLVCADLLLACLTCNGRCDATPGPALACGRRFAPCLPRVQLALWCNSWASACMRAQIGCVLLACAGSLLACLRCDGLCGATLGPSLACARRFAISCLRVQVRCLLASGAMGSVVQLLGRHLLARADLRFLACVRRFLLACLKCNGLCGTTPGPLLACARRFAVSCLCTRSAVTCLCLQIRCRLLARAGLPSLACACLGCDGLCDATLGPLPARAHRFAISCLCAQICSLLASGAMGSVMQLLGHCLLACADSLFLACACRSAVTCLCLQICCRLLARAGLLLACLGCDMLCDATLGPLLIRSLLGSGAMGSVMQLLGRPYRFVLLLDDASRILSPSYTANSQQPQQQDQHWSMLPAVKFSYPPNLQPQSAAPAQFHASSSRTTNDRNTTSTSQEGCRSGDSSASTSGAGEQSSPVGRATGIVEAGSSTQGVTEAAAVNVLDRRHEYSGNSSNAAPGQGAAPSEDKGQPGVHSTGGAQGQQGEGSDRTHTVSSIHPQSVPMQVLNQPPGQGLFPCQVALVPCHQQGGAEEWEGGGPDGWPGPQAGTGDLPPALASLEEERAQGIESNAHAYQFFSRLHVRIGEDMLSLEPTPGSQPSAAFRKLLRQAQAIGRAPCYLAIDFDQ